MCTISQPEADPRGEVCKNRKKKEQDQQKADREEQVKDGCDGWGEPAGYCQHPVQKSSAPNWLTDFPGWLKWQVFDAAGTTFTLWADAPDPQMSSSGPAKYLQLNTAIIRVLVTFVAVFAVAWHLMFARDGTSARDGVKALAIAALVSTGVSTVIDLLVKLARDYSNWYIVKGLGGSPSQSPKTAIHNAMTTMISGLNDDSHWFLACTAALVIFGVSLVQYFYMITRFFFVLFMGAALPIIAAGAATGSYGRNLFKKQCILVGTWIFVIDFGSMAFVMGMQLFQEQASSPGAEHQWRALVILLLVTATYPATLRAAKPFLSEAAGSSSATMAGARALPAAGAMVLGGVGGAVLGKMAGAAGARLAGGIGRGAGTRGGGAQGAPPAGGGRPGGGAPVGPGNNPTSNGSGSGPGSGGGTTNGSGTTTTRTSPARTSASNPAHTPPPVPAPPPAARLGGQAAAAAATRATTAANAAARGAATGARAAPRLDTTPAAGTPAAPDVSGAAAVESGAVPWAPLPENLSPEARAILEKSHAEYRERRAREAAADNLRAQGPPQPGDRRPTGAAPAAPPPSDGPPPA